MHQVTERWEYDVPGGPPRKYRKEIYSKAYVPGMNTHGTLKLMQEEETVFWTFAPFAKDVLSYRKEVNAWVIYDLKPQEDLDADAQATLEEQGIRVMGADGMMKRMFIASARLWHEAIQRGSVVRKADANQISRWVTAVITEENDVTEEPDKYTEWVYYKNQIRPDDNKVDGPRYIPKEGWTYQLDVPISPPMISATDGGTNGVRIEVRGGVARIAVPVLTGAKYFERKAESYKIFRRVISEADRGTDDDPHNLWLNPPGWVEREVIEDTYVGDYNGTEDPDEGLPSQTPYTEPGDPDPVIPDTWYNIADVDNQAEDKEYGEPFAVCYDPDVKAGSEYAYAAVAVIQDSESPLSQEARIVISGDGPHLSRITIRRREDGTIEGDMDIPARNPDEDIGLGEIGEWTIPALVSDGDWPQLALDCVNLTSAATINVEEITLYVTPKAMPELWTVGSVVRLKDIIGPGYPKYGSTLEPYTVYGYIKSTSDTTVVVEGIGADGHIYPAGALICVMGENYDERIDIESGDEFDGTAQSLVLAVGKRQGYVNSEDSYTLTVVLEFPLLSIRVGQHITFRDINWQAFGNLLWMRSRIEELPWMLKGYSIDCTRDGTDVRARTKLVLEQR
jgi:hypothetical protein